VGTAHHRPAEDPKATPGLTANAQLSPLPHCRRQLFLHARNLSTPPLFAEPENVRLLRAALRAVLAQWPFEVVAAVILPDHLHFIWALPPGDDAYARRLGRLKALFSSTYKATQPASLPPSRSRSKHRESNVWRRRYWEHAIHDEDDLKHHLDYIHYNPVKHGVAACHHAWPFSSFSRWVDQGEYDAGWGCRCNGREPAAMTFHGLDDSTGEP
jgi:putative transposase